MEITNKANLDVQKQSAATAENAGVIAKKEPELFKKIEEQPEVAGIVASAENAGVIAAAPVSETAGSVASASTSGGSVNTIA